ncbi:Transcription factor GLABRA 3 [Forsythia ovata]|uniref:Transcription factor GLABRA 3 n=1 Tax=Forsythia ovata TaxID=205694 RepID=A0ABD1W4H3_9LAMI
MAAGNKKQEEVTENMRKLQLDVAVRSIQWSYAIYWSISSTQQGVLEWADGYYNGDIKTRKSVQAGESPSDQPGLQRSEQLRELYESLYGGETNSQAAKRPSTALSPEDLTDTEWYYLVCMSFVFNIGQGLPGKTLAKNQTIWLCNAHRADTKSASIKTIVCFPHLGGVIELGVTELVLEDQNLIQQIKTCFLEIPVPIVSKIPNDHVCVELDHANMPETGFDPVVDCREVYVSSPDNCSNSFGATRLRDESDVFEGIDGEVSQLQSWQFMGDEISNCVNNSMNSSDSVSQTNGNPEKIVPILNETRECNQQKGDEIHYQSVLSTLLKGSNQFILGPYFGRCKRESSFDSWTKDGLLNAKTVQTRTPQRLLKKVLFDVARMHENCQLKSSKNKEKIVNLSTPEVDEIDRNHVLSERKRREKINKRFTILGSLVPSGGKVDKVSTLDNTIEYLRALERRVEELESCKGVVELESRTTSKLHDAIEQTSDNCGTNHIKKPLTNKRKACDMDELRANCKWILSHVQSSNTDGILSLTVKAQVKGSKVASEGVMRRAIQKVIRRV